MAWWHCICCIWLCCQSREQKETFQYKKFRQYPYEKNLAPRDVESKRPVDVADSADENKANKSILEWQEEVNKNSPLKLKFDPALHDPCMLENIPTGNLEKAFFINDDSAAADNRLPVNSYNKAFKLGVAIGDLLSEKNKK